MNVREQLRRLRYTLASTGLLRTLLDVADVLHYQPEHDRAFDEAFGTDTAGKVEPDALGIADERRRGEAILYLPSPPSVTRWMLGQLGVDHREFTFVDIGCGKGRVVLVASEYPFKAVRGVDISPELCAVARRNAEQYQPPARACREIRVDHGDATQFEFPPGDLVVHLYHPFAPEVTAEVLRRLGEAVAREPRRVVVAYLLYTAAVAPVGAAFAAASPWLKRVRYEQSLRGRYNWLVYSNWPGRVEAAPL